MLHNAAGYCLLHDSRYHKLSQLLYSCKGLELNSSVVVYGNGELPQSYYSTTLTNELEIYNMCMVDFLDKDNPLAFIANDEVVLDLPHLPTVLKYFDEREWDIILFTTSKGQSTSHPQINRLYKVEDIEGIITTRNVVETLVHRNIVEAINSMISHINVFGISNE